MSRRVNAQAGRWRHGALTTLPPASSPSTEAAADEQGGDLSSEGAAIHHRSGRRTTSTPTHESGRRSRVRGRGTDPELCDYGLCDKHDQHVVELMQKIMFITIEDSEHIQESLLSALFSALGKTGAAISARKLASNVLEHTAGKFKSDIAKFIISSLIGDTHSSNDHINRGIISEVYQCAPKVFEAVVPSITGELLADEVGIRFKAVELLGELFALPRGPVLEYFKPLFTEFLNRLMDTEVIIRISVIKILKRCLMLNHSHIEVSEIIKALHDRLSDNDENVRMEAVTALCDVVCQSPGAIPADTIKAVAVHLHDESWAVKSYTMERLVDIYKLCCLRVSNGSTSSDEFEWIPGKLFRCFLDKDFRNMNYGLLSGFLNHLLSQFLPGAHHSLVSNISIPPEFPNEPSLVFLLTILHWTTTRHCRDFITLAVKYA